MDRPLAGLLAHINPPFMAPAVGISLYGALLAPTVSISVALLYAAAVASALFVAHLRDGYVDGHRRGEEQPVLSRRQFTRAIRVAIGVTVSLAVVLIALTSSLAGLSVGVLLLLAYCHVPVLDRHPVFVTVDYPIGIAIALLGGFLAQTGELDPTVSAVAILFALVLSGIKISIDRLDMTFDRSIGKRTIPVLYGPAGATRIAVAVFVGAAVLPLAGVAVAVFPPVARWIAIVPVACVVVLFLNDPQRIVRIQMGLTYLLAVGLFAVVCEGGCAITPRAVYVFM